MADELLSNVFWMLTYYDIVYAKTTTAVCASHVVSHMGKNLAIFLGPNVNTGFCDVRGTCARPRAVHLTVRYVCEILFNL